MKLEEHCLEAEARLRGLEERLLKFDPAALEECLRDLSKVKESLQQWIAAPQQVDTRDRESLKLLGERAGRLLYLADFGNQLCQGWIQLRLGVGYTRGGQPWILGSEPKATYEG